MSQFKIIALSGWKGSGKDEVAKYLKQQYFIHRVALADPLKAQVASEFNIPLEWCHDPDYKEKPIVGLPVAPKDKFSEAIVELLKNELKLGYWTPRALCILKGSTCRAVDSDHWLKATIKDIKDEMADPSCIDLPNVVAWANGVAITDVRYRSEMEALKKEFPNIACIRINRHASINTTDPSERDLDDYSFDYVIENKGTIKQLHKAIDEVMDAISKKS